MQPRELTPLVLSPPMNIINPGKTWFIPALEDFFGDVPSKVIGWDIETTMHNDFYYRKSRTCQFGTVHRQIVVDLLELCDGDADLLEKCQGNYGKNLHLAPKVQEFIKATKPILCSGDWLKVGVNLGFEYMTFYWNFGLRTWKFWDCTMVEKAIYAGAHSLKDYSFFGMEEMVGRYLGNTVDKELQTSFTIDQPLSVAQIEYAALDTRLPLTLRSIQQLILNGRTAKNNTNPSNAKFFNYIDPLVTGDDLNWPAQIENECIGAFQDMHVHGDRIDVEKWKKRIAGKKEALKENVKELDKIFIEIVGSKFDIVTEKQIAQAREDWKIYALPSYEEKELTKITHKELALAKEVRKIKTYGGILGPEYDPILELETIRKARLDKKQLLKQERDLKKEGLKKIASELGKKRTRINKLAAQCEGDALVHYKSNAQLLKLVQGMKGLKSVKNLDDTTLSKYEDKYPIMKLIHEYHSLSKEIGTYGDQWSSKWVSKPGKEEGWLHPGDGKLHCVYNQFDAETGRSSSEKPNGQNLPSDFDVRSCFIVDPPDESIRISRCCQSECVYKFNNGVGGYLCEDCSTLYSLDQTDPEEYVMVTADMSGAELRIIAELSGDPIWIGAFSRGEDVHSVGTEILYAELWPTLTEEGCLYFAVNPETGEPMRQKCECKGHKKLRNSTKAVNFLLAYGGGPSKLAQEIGKTVEEARELMQLHEKMFPKVWAYLLKSGNDAKMSKKSFDLFGGRRLFPSPDWEKAKAHAKEKKEEKLRLSEEVCEKNIAAYIVKHGHKPKGDILYGITHRQPTSKEIGNSFQALHGNIERQGKNHAIQGSNARIAKIAMGCGFDHNGVPYLWHTLEQYKAKLIKFVHDELVIQCPKRYGQQVAALVGDAFKRAADEKMKLVVMEFSKEIETYWSKG